MKFLDRCVSLEDIRDSRLAAAPLMADPSCSLPEQDMLEDLTPQQYQRLTHASSVGEFFQVLWELRAPAVPTETGGKATECWTGE